MEIKSLKLNRKRMVRVSGVTCLVVAYLDGLESFLVDLVLVGLVEAGSLAA